jgi:hypothetical protein
LRQAPPFALPPDDLTGLMMGFREALPAPPEPDAPGRGVAPRNATRIVAPVAMPSSTTIAARSLMSSGGRPAQ